jgi:ABC-type bacteriocin/lantibiotic exporter with double-glycine peptidase domain
MVTRLSYDRYRSNLRKHPEGGLYLEIPMIDQGDSSYCYPASMARILNYYGRNVDMLSVAKVAGSDAKQGTNTLGIIAALGRAAAKLEVYPVASNGKSLTNFASFIMDAIDKGQPVLWLCSVDGGGHARIINGYNAAKQEVIFTDSWGQGHEADRMSLKQAYAITDHYLRFVPKEVQTAVRIR